MPDNDTSTAPQPADQPPVFKTVVNGEMVDAPPQEQKPDKSVSLAPQSAAEYEMPELTDATLAAPLAQGAFDFGLTVAEVKIIDEKLRQTAPESLTRENCDRELLRMWGSPQEVKRHIDLIKEAFKPEMQKYLSLFVKTKMDDSPIVLQMLYQAAQRRLGRYSR